MPHGEPEEEALLDKLYEEFVRGAGSARERFKAKVRAYHAIQVGKILVGLKDQQERFEREVEPWWARVFLRGRG